MSESKTALVFCCQMVKKVTSLSHLFKASIELIPICKDFVLTQLADVFFSQRELKTSLSTCNASCCFSL